jgi:hypothetical protein
MWVLTLCTKLIDVFIGEYSAKMTTINIKTPCKWCDKNYKLKTGGIKRHQHACPVRMELSDKFGATPDNTIEEIWLMREMLKENSENSVEETRKKCVEKAENTIKKARKKNKTLFEHYWDMCVRRDPSLDWTVAEIDNENVIGDKRKNINKTDIHKRTKICDEEKETAQYWQNVREEPLEKGPPKVIIIVE